MRSISLHLMFSMIVILAGFQNARPEEPTWLTSLWPDDHNYNTYYPDNFGRSVAVRNVNGDGYADLVVSSSVSIYVYAGPLPAQDVWA